MDAESGIVWTERNIGPEWREPCGVEDCPASPEGMNEESQGSYLSLNYMYPNFFDLAYGSVSGAVSAGYQAASDTANNLYSTVENYTSEFAEKVRQVLREEFFYLLFNSSTDLIDAVTAPG